MWAVVRRLFGTICAETAAVRSDIEENGLVLALDPDVEAVDRQLAPHLFVGNERPAPVSRHQ